MSSEEVTSLDPSAIGRERVGEFANRHSSDPELLEDADFDSRKISRKVVSLSDINPGVKHNRPEIEINKYPEKNWRNH